MIRRDLRQICNSFVMSPEDKDLVLEKIMAERPKDVQMKGRKWHPRGQAPAWICIGIVIVLIIAALIVLSFRLGLVDQLKELMAAAAPETTQTVPAETDTSTLPTTLATEPQQLSYQPLAAKYVQAIREDWDMARCEEEDISYLVMFLDKPEDLSCAVTDLDGNGIDEMIVTDGMVIYDLYTCYDGEYVHILSGAERNSYSLTADGRLVNVASSGAGNTVYRFSLYFETHLIPIELIVCDASRDASAPWFRGINDAEQVQPITEQEARDIIAQYPRAPITSTTITAFD